MLYQGSKIVLGKGTHDLGDTTLILDREVSIVGEAGVPWEVRRRPTALAFAIPRLIISCLPGHPHPCLFFPPSFSFSPLLLCICHLADPQEAKG